MDEGVHVRLMVTRGIRSTPYQDPRVVISPATIVIIPEYKEPLPATVERGHKLFTVHVRRGDPGGAGPKLNSHSKLNCITACIQATQAGADEALMLDPHGFVATCNSTHFFIVRKRARCGPRAAIIASAGSPAVVLEIAASRAFRLREEFLADRRLRRRRSLRHRHLRRHRAGARDRRAALTDGRGPMVERLQQLYRSASRRTSRSRPGPVTPSASPCGRGRATSPRR
jgi:branched-chain amino acid aminotransferase